MILFSIFSCSRCWTREEKAWHDSWLHWLQQNKGRGWCSRSNDETLLSQESNSTMWTRAFFYNFIDMAALNAYIVWSYSHGKERRGHFLESLIDELKEKYVTKTSAKRMQSLPSTSSSTESKRERCVVCKPRKNHVRRPLFDVNYV